MKQEITGINKKLQDAEQKIKDAQENLTNLK
jgi:hypothetical protein